MGLVSWAFDLCTKGQNKPFIRMYTVKPGSDVNYGFVRPDALNAHVTKLIALSCPPKLIL